MEKNSIQLKDDLFETLDIIDSHYEKGAFSCSPSMARFYGEEYGEKKAKDYIYKALYFYSHHKDKRGFKSDAKSLNLSGYELRMVIVNSLQQYTDSWFFNQVNNSFIPITQEVPYLSSLLSECNDISNGVYSIAEEDGLALKEAMQVNLLRAYSDILAKMYIHQYEVVSNKKMAQSLKKEGLDLLKKKVKIMECKEENI